MGKGSGSPGTLTGNRGKIVDWG